MSECRRCAECSQSEHHWLDNDDFGNLDNPENPASVNAEYVCKHCDALGNECGACSGEGGYDVDGDDECGMCDGTGIKAVKPEV